ncbi:MAG: hypothetical protein OEZ40_09395 [Candidatus Bathyarchaeota archaeon]|nr:hypothetical protein [Candidatus Bathyarchaeota archaeon]
MPKDNHWKKRTILVFAFILLDYFSTLAFCKVPYEEANLFARTFMEVLGIPLGLTLFVMIANLPIYMTLSLDSHIIRLSYRRAILVEIFVDTVFAWFIAGLHFSGGTSWFWYVPDIARQTIGATAYLVIAFLLIKPHKSFQDSQELLCM